MRDSTVVMCYLPLLCMTAGAMLLALKRDRGKRLTKSFALLAGALFMWQALAILFYLSSNVRLVRLFYDLYLPFVCMTAVGLLLFVLKFFSFDLYLTRAVFVLLCIVPFFTLMLALTCEHHDYLREGITFLSTGPVTVVSGARGVWFWVHAAYSYLLVFVSAVVALTQHWRLPKIYRGSSRLLLFGIIATMAGNLFVISSPPGTQIDYSLIGGTICILCLYVTIRKTQGLDFLNKARENIFNEIDDAIFVLDDEGKVLNRNMAAKYLMLDAGLGVKETNYEKIKTVVFQTEGVPLDDEDDGTDYAHGGRVLNVKEKAILDKTGGRLGAIAICRDVSANRALIRRLEDEAGLDAMTGLLNRREMDKKLALLDQKENLPLAIILGDINGLKQINDSFGHLQGDVMIRAVGEAIISCCPPKAWGARIGGDEFLIAVPSFELERALRLTEDIGSYLQKNRSTPFEVGVSFGVCLKMEEGEPLAEAIRCADERMFQQKKGGRDHRASGAQIGAL